MKCDSFRQPHCKAISVIRSEVYISSLYACISRANALAVRLSGSVK